MGRICFTIWQFLTQPHHESPPQIRCNVQQYDILSTWLRFTVPSSGAPICSTKNKSSVNADDLLEVYLQRSVNTVFKHPFRERSPQRVHFLTPRNIWDRCVKNGAPTNIHTEIQYQRLNVHFLKMKNGAIIKGQLHIIEENVIKVETQEEI